MELSSFYSTYKHYFCSFRTYNVRDYIIVRKDTDNLIESEEQSKTYIYDMFTMLVGNLLEYVFIQFKGNTISRYRLVTIFFYFA